MIDFDNALYQSVSKAVEDCEGAYVQRYSGRGMYGRQCLAFVANPADMGQIMMAVRVEMNKNDHDHRDMPAMAQDNMGKNMVYYWPAVGWEEEWSE